MNYSTLSGLLFALPIFFSVLLLPCYLSYRKHRHLKAQGAFPFKPNRNTATIIIVFIVFILSAWLIDNVWDTFRATYNVPARTMDGKLLEGFASIGVFATFLTTFIILVEVSDWLRAKRRGSD